jgi:hypothetical protein
MFKTLPICLLLAGAFLLAGCQKEELPKNADAIYVKFVNKAGSNLTGLAVSRLEVEDLSKGKSSDYLRYESLGEQFQYALVDATCMMNGKRYYRSSACSGICGTPSAPNSKWLDKGYYKVVITKSGELGGNYLDFRLSN